MSKVKKQKVSAISIAENKFFVYGMLGIFLVMVFLASSYKVSGDDDFFWHLATGRFIVENKYVPDKDIFGYLTQNDEWIPFEWGWDIISYGLYSLGGYNAILVFRSIIFCLIFFLYFHLLRKFKINSFISILFLFLLLVSIIDRLSPRPHIFTYLFIVIILYIILSFKYLNRDKYLRYFYFFPLIFLLWGNIHMGVLVGGLIVFIFNLSEIIIYFNQKSFINSGINPLPPDHLKRVFIISAVSALVLLINPHGFQTYVYANEHTKMELLKTINEWQNPFTGGLQFGFVVTLYKIFLFSGFLVLIYAFTRKDLFFGLMTIGFAIYSVRAIRFTVDYEIVMTFFIANSVNYFIYAVLKESLSKNNYLNANFLKIIISAFFIYIITQIPNNKIYEKMEYYRIYGWGINDDYLAIQAMDFMKENNIKGRPFNHFGTGGCIAWYFPDQKNFLDSRNLNDRIFNEYQSIMNLKPGFEKKLDEYGIEYILYLDPDLIRRPNELKRFIPAYASRNSNWKLVFWDDKSMLFLKNVPKYSELINKYEYKVLNPYNFIFHKKEFEQGVKANQESAKIEMKRKSETEPNGNLQRVMQEVALSNLQNK